MNMLTHCPACKTRFRLTREQLTAHKGQVRCGHCGSVFDAFATLQLNQEAKKKIGRPEATSTAIPTVETATKTPLPTAHYSNVSRSKKTATPKTKWLATLLWGIGVLMLAILGVGQAMHFYRVDLATLYPEIKPYLMEYCQLLKCDIPLPKPINLVSIEASDLQTDNKRVNLMILTATLRNRANHTIEYPYLELTLTDIENNALARRVLKASDYLAAGNDIASGFSAHSDIEIKIYIDSSQIKAFGYKLWLFYS